MFKWNYLWTNKTCLDQTCRMSCLVLGQTCLEQDLTRAQTLALLKFPLESMGISKISLWFELDSQNFLFTLVRFQRVWTLVSVWPGLYKTRGSALTSELLLRKTRLTIFFGFNRKAFSHNFCLHSLAPIQSTKKSWIFSQKNYICPWLRSSFSRFQFYCFFL